MSINEAKKKAGHAAVDNHVRPDMKVGIGSGSTIVYSIERVAEKIEKGELDGILAVCTSFQSTIECRARGIEVTTLDDPRVNGELDVAIDGADEFDEHLNLIKGGGGAHAQEKIIAAAAKVFVVIVDDRKQSKMLGEKWAVPIEVLPLAMTTVTRAIEKMGGKPALRMAERKAGPVISDNGNLIIDAALGTIEDPFGLERDLNAIPGVVENGIFTKMTSVLYMGKSDGSVERFEPN